MAQCAILMPNTCKIGNGTHVKGLSYCIAVSWGLELTHCYNIDWIELVNTLN